ncbi:MAG: hypothetical protein M9939_12275 [Mesorhizobium sp.]|nr:hypothetical protein [Mesorhizobium sp.]MCO5161909.1 hypothetical protein [Mesorhizobium sp.]
MLIATSNCFDPAGDLGHLLAWDGPSLLVFLPGSNPGRSTLLQLEKDFLVLDCLEKPLGGSYLLMDVLSFLKVRFETEDWPLLYLDRPCDENFITEQGKLGRFRPGDLEASFSDAGDLATLRLGEMIATSPILRDVVSYMCQNRIDDRRMVDLFRLSFPGERA